MKKTLSALTALILALSLTITAFASTKSDVKIKMDGAAKYLYSTTEFDYTKSSDYIIYLRSGNISSASKSKYIKSVKDALISNGGKLYYNSVETTYMYALVIQCLNILGENTKDFYSYNLNSLLANSSVDSIDNPYYYRSILEACKTVNAPETFVKAVLNKYISNYKMGEGYDYYGYGCDNTATFLASIAVYKDQYKTLLNPYIEDATKMLKTYEGDNGFFYNPAYGTDANTNSTAYALMAFSIIGDKKADTTYKKLLGFESTEKSGVFTYYGKENAYATKDALNALYYYNNTLADESKSTTTTKQSTTAANTTTSHDKSTSNSSTSTTKKDNSSKSPSTGNTAVVAESLLCVLAFSALLYRKKQ